MSHNLDCLVYENKDQQGRVQTTAYSSITGMPAEEVEKHANEMRLSGKVNVRALSWADYDAIELEEAKERLDLNKPNAVDYAEFMEKLNVLPPCRWLCTHSTEVFFLSGALTGNIHTFYVRLGRGDSAKFFKVNAQTTSSNDEILKLCTAA